MQLLQWQTKGGLFFNRFDFMNSEEFIQTTEEASTDNWMKCSINCQINLDGCKEPFCKATRNNDDEFSLNYTRNCSQVPTCSTMPERFTPTLVYQRRRWQKSDGTNFSVQPSNGAKSGNGCHSIVGSKAPSLAAEEHVLSVSQQATDALRSIMDPVKYSGLAMPSATGCHGVKENGTEDVLTNNEDRILNAHKANKNSLSLKLNLGPHSGSLKTEMVNGGVDFISGASIVYKRPEEISQRDVCVSILRRQGLLDDVLNRQHRALDEGTVLSSDCYCSMACKVCERTESTSNMLLCDNCEDAFHVSCYNPKMTLLPRGEWLCSSCLKKKHKLLEDKSSGAEIGRNHYSTSEGELGSLEFMFTDTEPYMSNVRIGDEFQAEVPYWHGPVNEPSDLVGDPLEMNSHNNFSMEEPMKPLKLNSIGNWIQCQGVIEGINDDVNGTICGKWRRAPLFESQNEEWECYRCILWDPARADCAVPQELETAEITRQLKYMEMLKPPLPGLAGKRRRLDSLKGTTG